MDKEKLQKEIVDAISQIAKNEASKNNKITIVKGEITGVDPLNCYYNFSYDNHLYSARSVLGGYSVGQKVFVAFSGEQENNIILCGEIIGGGTVAGSEERVLSSITQQYYISNSSEIEPPQNPGEGAQYQWSDERLEPTKEAPYLWSRYKYTYTDGSVEYSTPYVINVTEAINESNETITDYIDNSIGNIQSQIDKQADIWFYNGVPTLNTYPANEWTTDEIKDIHVGDLYFDTSETAGKAYEFKKNQSTYLWQLVQDQDVIKALNDAAKAQDTADNKRRVFYSTPVPPYDKGDLWVQGANGDILYCNVPKKSGATYSRSDWVVASKYTDDSNLNIFKEEYTHYKEDNDRKWENTLGKITTIEGQVQENTSSIQQNADNITLRAQETTELKNNLETNYYTKKESDAAIKVSADSITSTVSGQISSIESNAIKTTVNYYLQNNGETPSKTDPSWSTSQPRWVNGKHIWLKVKTTKIDGTVSESDPVDLTGATGATGAGGADGVGIVSVTQQYYQSDSDTQAPSGNSGWSTTQPNYVEGKYIWIRYDTLLDNGSHSYSTPTLDRNLNGVYGEIKRTESSIKQTTDSISLKVEGIAKDYTKKSEILLDINESGETGIKISADKIDLNGVISFVGDSGFVTETQLRTPGATVIDGGNIYADSITIGSFDTDLKNKVNGSIKNVRIQYASNNSSTTPPTTGWSDNAPQWKPGQYIWQRTETTLSDGTKTHSDALCITGVKGDTGNTGATGTGISSITVEFYLSNSKTTQTGGSWTTTQPIWTTGKYLWTRQKIVYKNPASTVYTTPQCDSSWEAVNEVEVGGRNLLKNSNFSSSLSDSDYSTRGDAYSLSIETDGYKGSKCLKAVAKKVGNNGTDIRMIMTSENEPSTEYVFSGFAKSDNETTLVIRFGYGNETSQVKIGTEWSYFSSIVKSGTETYNELLPYINSLTTIYFSNIKLEKGNKATDWTPAPEDVQQGIDNAQDAANNANSIANKAQNAANNAQNTANNAASDADAAQSAAENAQSAAENAQQAADNAQEMAGNAQQVAMEAQAASDKANELASGATAGLQQMSQVFYADSTGAHVKAANDNETVIQSDGMHVMVGNTEVARFTRDDSHVDNLAIGRFLMFGAHRAEIYEQDGEVGTGFFWIGDVQ